MGADSRDVMARPADGRRGEVLAEVRDRLSDAEVARAVGQVRRVHGALDHASAAEVAGLWADLQGAGPLQPLLDDPAVTDVLVNGPGPVWVDAGRGLVALELGLDDENSIRALAVRLAASAGRRLDAACPYVDARLRAGVRLHAVLPPISAQGTLISLRVPRRRAFAVSELVELGTVPARWAELLRTMVTGKLAFLVCGGTGTGKTTVLSSLLSQSDPAERVVLVEDAAELRPELPHVVRLEARRPNTEGTGEVTLADLVNQALRMRPDRLVVGECRGAEVRDLLSALNTGHEGGCGTIHANAAVDVAARLEALGCVAGLTPAATAAQAASALDAVIGMRRVQGRREVTEIGWVTRRGDSVQVVPALRRGPERDGLGSPGPGWEPLRDRLREAGWQQC